MPIEHVSDTARWVAVYRAMESARPDALFRDPYAERLAGPEGVQIVEGMKQGRRMAWAMIVRTAVLDEMILERIRTQRVDTVINLAAGLDTRAWRLDLPASLQWFDLDLPAMSAYKRDQMARDTPRCRYEALAVDLTSPDARDEALRRLGGVATRALVVTEGLLVYLTTEQVASLARALHAQHATSRARCCSSSWTAPGGAPSSAATPPSASLSTTAPRSSRPSAGESSTSARAWTKRAGSTARCR
jgi:methyltransferase (TIGR00027 family)